MDFLDCIMPEVEDSDLDTETAEQILAQVYFGDEGVDEELLQSHTAETMHADCPAVDYDNDSICGRDSVTAMIENCCSDDEHSTSAFVSPSSPHCGDDDDDDDEAGCWDINERDAARGNTPTGVRGRYYNRSSIRCHNCNESGHIAKDCPSPKKVRPCYLCGLSGHFSEECPDQLCFRCFRQGHMARACRIRPYDVCQRCFCQGHSASVCTDLWRQYHNTQSNDAKLVQDKEEGNRRFCYNCGRQGHWGHECAKDRMSYFAPAMPFVAVYKKGSIHETKKRKHEWQHYDSTPQSKRHYSDYSRKKRRHSDGAYQDSKTPQNEFWRKSHEKSHKSHHRLSTAPERHVWQSAPPQRENRHIFFQDEQQSRTPPTKKRKSHDSPASHYHHHKPKHSHHQSADNGRHFESNGMITIQQSKKKQKQHSPANRGFKTSTKAARIRKHFT